MAFDIAGWGGLSSSPTQNVYSYATSVDKLAQVSIAGYFSSKFNLLHENDLIRVEATDGTCDYLVRMDAGSRTVALAFANEAAVRSRRFQSRIQIVGTRGHVPGTATAAGGDTNASQTSRMWTIFGRSAVTNLTLVFPGWEIGTGEANNANAITVTAAAESGAQNWPAWANGARSIVVQPGTNGCLELPGMRFPADSGLWLRVAYDVTAGQFWPIGGISQSRSGEASGKSASASSQVYGTGALTGTSAINGIAPMAVLGIPEQPFPSVIILGDSIAYGTGDSTAGDSLGARGFIQRGLVNVNGHQVPWASQARPGEGALTSQLSNLGWRKTSLWKYATHMICNFGTNDMTTSSTLAEVKANLQAIWATGIANGLSVYQCKIMPRTDVSNVAIARFGVGQDRDLLNTWMDTQLGTYLDGIIDPNPYVESPTAHGTWLTVPADGVHPDAAGHIAASAAVNQAAASFG